MHNKITLIMQALQRLASYDGDFVPARSASADSVP